MFTVTTSISVIHLTERELIEGCIRGNRAYQNALYKNFKGRMMSLCLRYAGDYHTAEDILQEGFVKIFHNLDRFRSEGSFEGWMKRIFINTAIEVFRKSGSQAQFTEIEKADQECVQENAHQRLATQDLMRFIHKLSPGYRAVFNLYAIEGYSHKEIADLLDISEGTSKSQLARARGILQEMIQTSKSAR